MNPFDWLDRDILGNTLLAWSTAFGVFLVAWLVLGVAVRIFRGRLRVLAESAEYTSIRIAQHAVSQTKAWFLFIIALFAGSRSLQLMPLTQTVLTSVTTVAFLVQAGLWANAALGRFLKLRREQKLEEDPDAVAVMDLLGFVLRVAVWSVVLLVTLDNLGVNITTLVAGLGVGGIAVALAAQNILGDLFASLSIVLDKPFVVGDFLIIGEFLGSVEKVGLKTTRVRSLSGEQLIFSNNDLLSSRIRNYGRMYERRVVFSLGVTYQTPADKLRMIPGIIREAIEAQDDVRFDRAHFQKYGDFALIFEAVYYVLSPDYNVYMDIQQAINLTVYERFAEQDIEFAYPTQTLYVLGQDSGAETRAQA
jgi:small-conductance mechanosensitive channel